MNIHVYATIPTYNHGNSVFDRVNILEHLWITHHDISIYRNVAKRQDAGNQGDHVQEAKDYTCALRKLPATHDYCVDRNGHVHDAHEDI